MSFKSIPKKVISNKEENNIVFKKLKRWIYTGSINNVFLKEEKEFNPFCRKFVLLDTNKTKEYILDALVNGVSKKTIIQALSLLTTGDIQSKKVVKEIFNTVIKTFEDLFYFIYITKSYRGLGTTITKCINKWISSHSFDFLQEQVLLYPRLYGFSFNDVVRMTKPIPRSQLEEQIFKYSLKRFKCDDLKLFKCCEDIKDGKNVIDNIKKYKIDNRLFPPGIKHTSILWKEFFKNLSCRNVVKNIDKLISYEVFDEENIKLLKNKLVKSSLDPFFIISHIKNIKNNEIRNIFEDWVRFSLHRTTFTKKVKSFVDTDLQFSECYGVNALSIPIFFDYMYNTNLESFYKNKFDKINTSNIYNIDFMYYNTSGGLFDTYSRFNMKYIAKYMEEEHPEVIILWVSGKKIEIKDEYFNNKKVILVYLKESKYSYGFNNKNIYTINGFNQNTCKIIKLIVEGKI